MDVREETDRFFWAMMMNEIGSKDRFRDVSYQSLLYLDLVKYSGRCTVGSIAEVLGLDKSTVSRKVDSLVEEGLISKERDPDDGRIQILRPGPGWGELYDAMDEPYYRGIARISSELSPEEVQAFCKGLRMMSEELERS